MVISSYISIDGEKVPSINGKSTLWLFNIAMGNGP
jgi:hypothetical protein